MRQRPAEPGGPRLGQRPSPTDPGPGSHQAFLSAPIPVGCGLGYVPDPE